MLVGTHFLPVGMLDQLQMLQLSACLQAVELIQLPPNTPERVHVICNGRSGILTLRTQRVLAGGTEMSASRFETVCGKGDAKKWKCSIFLEIQPGVSGQVGLQCTCLPSAPSCIYHRDVPA